ncbi:MAG TPA: CBS domain-containing protein [Pirellulaceae bacterium]|nr:CBS domain-containing protein [Pirellulaceae bacterium]
MFKKLGELTARDLMTPDVISVHQQDRLIDAIRKIDDFGVSALPVVADDNKVVGIVSMFDLLNVSREIHSDLSALSLVTTETRKFMIKLLAEQEDTTKIEDVMTTPVNTIHEETNIVVAARQMVHDGYRHLPVVDDHERVVGMVSSTDFVRVVAEQGALVAG